jgi:hypothetical protein
MHNWLKGVLKHHWAEQWGYHKKNNYKEDISDEEPWEQENEPKIPQSQNTDENFQKELLVHIWKEAENIVVPRGVLWVPKNLGEPSSGKLKASKWHTLFSVYLPLAVIDFLVTSAEAEFSPTQHWLTHLNFAALVVCTKIVTKKSITLANIKKFQESYPMYTDSSQQAFSNVKIMPNHHYALHLPDQMRWWGTLMAISEFAWERINSLLQSTKTNGQLG